MKTKIITAVTVVGLLLTTGCAQLGPLAVSPRVYKSSRDVFVSQNRAEANNQELEIARANEWQKVAIGEIQGKTGGDAKDKTISVEGVLGGFPCLFVNDSRRTKSLTVQKVGGFLGGQKWNFNLPGLGGMKKYKLPDGYYLCWWTTEYSGQKYGPDRFRVTIVPHYYYGATEENFHGGYRLFGY